MEQKNQNTTIQEETAFITVNDATEVQETTVIDQRYDGLLNVIESLKEQLISEKQKNLMLERKTERDGNILSDYCGKRQISLKKYNILMANAGRKI